MRTTPRPSISSRATSAELGAEGGQREVVGGDLEGVLGAGLGVLEGGLELGAVGVGELPDVGVADVGAAPRAALLERTHVGGAEQRHRAGACGGAADAAGRAGRRWARRPGR